MRQHVLGAKKGLYRYEVKVGRQRKNVDKRKNRAVGLNFRKRVLTQ